MQRPLSRCWPWPRPCTPAAVPPKRAKAAGQRSPGDRAETTVPMTLSGKNKLWGASAPQRPTLLQPAGAEEFAVDRSETPMPPAAPDSGEEAWRGGLPERVASPRRPAHPDVICRLKTPSAPKDHQTRMAEERGSADCPASGDASASYLEVRMSVIGAAALPIVRDGLKAGVQRRVLFGDCRAWAHPRSALPQVRPVVG